MASVRSEMSKSTTALQRRNYPRFKSKVFPFQLQNSASSAAASTALKFIWKSIRNVTSYSLKSTGAEAGARSGHASLRLARLSYDLSSTFHSIPFKRSSAGSLHVKFQSKWRLGLWYLFAVITTVYFVFKCTTLIKHLRGHESLTSDAVVHMFFIFVYLIFAGLNLSIFSRLDEMLFFNNQTVYLENQFAG